MRVELLVPDAPPGSAAASPDASSSPSAFARALDSLGGVFDSAEGAEDAFAQGRGSLQDAVIERARADVALSIAAATAQRGAQAISSLLNMQI